MRGSAPATDAPSAVQDVVPVSRETAAHLGAYVDLLRKWQKAENLVSAKTLPEVWTRHVADSAQIVALFPTVRRWLDIGSGAGLPGLIVAIVGPPGTEVHLIESNRRKCAFLRQAIRETGAPAIVHEGRVEDVIKGLTARIDLITARAVAPLTQLLALAEPLMASGTPAGFHKGADFEREIDEAYQSWEFDLVKHDSRIGDGGVILQVSNVRRKPGLKRTSVD